MNDDDRLTFKEKQLIRELTQAIAEINSNNSEIKEIIFRGLSSYVEGIKVGIKFPNYVKSQRMPVESFHDAM